MQSDFGAAKLVELGKHLEELADEKVLVTCPGEVPTLVSLCVTGRYFIVRVLAFLDAQRPSQVMSMTGELVSAEEVQLCDISSDDRDNNKGFGSLAMPHFLAHAKALDARRVTGDVAPVDWSHIHRLVHFYRKHGFTVNLWEDINLKTPPTKNPAGKILRLL